MAALLDGDEQAFNALLDRHLDAVHRYLLRQLNNHADADELSQETFFRLWSEAPRFNAQKSRLTTWLHRIAHNLMVDRLRRRHTENAGDEVLDTLAAPTTQTAAGERFRWLNSALAALPEQQRWALALVYLQGFSNAEAAGIMGLGVRALESLLARGRANLKRQHGEQVKAAPADSEEAKR